ncbi:MAG: YncE family protein [Bacteroidaceae bacterium]
MKRIHIITTARLWALCLTLACCTLKPADEIPPSQPSRSSDRLIVLCEGLWGMDNSVMAYLDNGVVTDNWFRKMNPGQKLGDTGNDILQVNDTLIAISVNWSNIIQYISPDGRAIAATEDIPNNRRLATDGKGYLYVTSYAHHGYVAKVNIQNKQIVDTCHVGYEPEGIAYYEGKLFVANTGGYAHQENHDYESTVSILDAQTMKELKRIDTGCINLYGTMTQSGQYLCINSAGDEYEVAPRCIIFNMANEEFRVFDFPATYSCAYGNQFFTIGSSFSYLTGEQTFSTHTITLPDMTIQEGLSAYQPAVEAISRMQSPYGIYISPYSGHMYVSDARAYATNGYLYEFDLSGNLINKYLIHGINPGHFLALE